MANQVSNNNGNVTVTTTQGDAQRLATTQAGANPLNGITLAQALTWIDNNVNDLATARTAMKHMTKHIFTQNERIGRLETQVGRLFQIMKRFIR